MRNSPSETTIGAYFLFSALSVITPSFLKNRFNVASPLIKAQTISPFSAAPLLLHDHPVAVHDAGADHAVAFDLQRKPFSAAHVVGDSQHALRCFLR